MSCPKASKKSNNQKIRKKKSHDKKAEYSEIEIQFFSLQSDFEIETKEIFNKKTHP